MDQFRPKDGGGPVRDIRRGVEDVQDIFERYIKGRGLWPILIVILLLYLASGFYKVGPGWRGVELLFGKVHAVTDPGLHYRLPKPFMENENVWVDKVRRIEIGFRSDLSRTRSVPAESLMLTGDENIVDAQLIIQYTIKDPEKFLFGCLAPEKALRASAEVALRGIVGENKIEYTMTEGREEIQDKVKVYLQKLVDEYNTGLEVTQARLLEVQAPAQVQEAFHDVVRAREDMDRFIKEAEGYREDILPKARGEAQQKLLRAEAYKAQRVIRAKGDAQRFTEVLREYTKYPEVTRERLYLESVQRFLPKSRKFIMEGGGNSRVLPLLPLMNPGTESPLPVGRTAEPGRPADKKNN